MNAALRALLERCCALLPCCALPLRASAARLRALLTLYTKVWRWAVSAICALRARAKIWARARCCKSVAPLDPALTHGNAIPQHRCEGSHCEDAAPASPPPGFCGVPCTGTADWCVPARLRLHFRSPRTCSCSESGSACRWEANAICASRARVRRSASASTAALRASTAETTSAKCCGHRGHSALCVQICAIDSLASG